jgi:hypothetical protein
MADRSASGDVGKERPTVEITAALAADLAALTDALDDSSAGLEAGLRQLGADAGRAVPSYLGLSLLVDVDGQDVVVTAVERASEPSDVRASIGLFLQPAVLLVLYATASGAFTDLAVDLVLLTERTGEDFALDQHLTIAETSTRSCALGDLSTVNQAIGVLIGQDGTVEQADHALRLLADSSRLDVDVASALLAQVDHTTHDSDERAT